MLFIYRQILKPIFVCTLSEVTHQHSVVQISRDRLEVESHDDFMAFDFGWLSPGLTCELARMLAEDVCTNTQHMRLILVNFSSGHVPCNKVICGAASMRSYPSDAQASGDRHSWVCRDLCALCILS